jgi:hypothetical protein
MSNLFRVRDKATGRFWNGQWRGNIYNDYGKCWQRFSRLESDIAHFLSQTKSKIPQDVNPGSWELVEYELVENEKTSRNLTETIIDTGLKAELRSIHYRLGRFHDEMVARGVMKDIEFIVVLTSPSGSAFHSIEEIKNYRAQLRLMGVKTRTFREFNGMFGMMDRAQAMKAKLSLDITRMIDVRELREKIKTKYGSSSSTDVV